jgi:hypothetical protein
MRNADSLEAGLFRNGLLGRAAWPGTRHGAGPEGEMCGNRPGARRRGRELGAPP